MAQVLTIPEAVQRAKSEGYPISEFAVRRWVKAGTLPVRKAGKKNLIFYPRLLEYLRCEDGGDNRPATTVQVPGIRRLEV